MSYVIQIDWLEGIGGAEATNQEGRFVSHYDPNAHDGRGEMRTVVDPQHALQFESVVEAYTFIKQTSSVKPIREDGMPNRPLTAFTVSVFNWQAP